MTNWGGKMKKDNKKNKKEEEKETKDEGTEVEITTSDDEETAETEETETADAKEVASLKADLAKAEEKNEKLNQQKLRIMAEYDNFKRRTQKEKSELYNDAVVDVNKLWLELYDNLERAVEAIEDLDKDSDVDEIKDALSGVKQIQKQGEKIIDSQGIKEIPALGEEFNPKLHAAVQREEASDDDEDSGKEIITEVFLKGYELDDRIIRHSLVKVKN